MGTLDHLLLRCANDSLSDSCLCSLCSIVICNHLESFCRYKSQNYLSQDTSLVMERERICFLFSERYNGTHLMLIIFNDTYLISNSCWTHLILCCRWSFRSTLSSSCSWPGLLDNGWVATGSGWVSPGQSDAVRSLNGSINDFLWFRN